MRLILTSAICAMALLAAPAVYATTSSGPATTANPGSVDSGGGPGSPMDDAPQMLEGTDEPGFVAGSEGPADVDAVTPADHGGHMANPETSGCGDHSSLVGRNINTVDVKAIEAERRVRVLKPGSAATMDYSAERLNIITDDAGLVLEVRCG